VSRLSAGGRVLVLTGFLTPLPETDGLVGSAVLALALERTLGVLPVFVAEQEVLPPLRAALRAAGLNVCEGLDHTADIPHPAVVLEFPYDRSDAEQAAAALSEAIQPAGCIAVERPGANPKGEYHFSGGRNVTRWIAPIDLLYDRVKSAGTLTIGIGDRGNELGLGAIGDVVRKETPAGANCGCGCGLGNACMTPADHTIVATTSDWGAYALSAALSHLKGDPGALISAEAYRRVLHEAVQAGAIDGPTKYAAPYIDGVDDGFNSHLLELMRGAVTYPRRSVAGAPNRSFRARRRLAGD
jgi:D-glutamate cyclase